MSAPALPTNRDENWRYANLRPLAKARTEDAGNFRSQSIRSISRPTAPVAPTTATRYVFFDMAGILAGSGNSAQTSSYI